MKGFTLIELLVVVLIIGILSSVALPQYTKAVLKSRTAEAWGNLKNLNMAGNAYCLENPQGSLASEDSFDELAIEVPHQSQNFRYWGNVDCSNGVIAFAASYDKNPNFYLYLHPKTGRRSCSGAGCKDIGFTKNGSDTNICVCGACGATGSCYYAD